MRKLTVTILAAVLLFNICPSAFARETKSTGGIFINEDGTNTISRPFDRVDEYNIDDKESVKNVLSKTMHDYAETQVTDVSVCANYRASLAKSNVIEDTQDLCEGIDWDEKDSSKITDTAYEYFYKVNYTHELDAHRIWFEQLKADGINPWLSFRMNDVHSALGDNTKGNTHFGLDAYEKGLTIGSHYDSAMAGFVDCLDYSKEEVRTRMFNYIEEQVTNYHDVLYGIELDFLRETFCFAPGGESEGRAVMTEYIEKIKALTDLYGLKITVRLPRDFVQSYDAGLDVLEWAKKGLISSVTVSPRVASCDSDMPIASWVKLLKKYGVTVNAGTDILYRSGGAGRNDSTKRFTNLENDYAQAMAYLSEGADKIYLFNHYLSWYDGYNQPFDSSDVADFGTRSELLNNAGSTETLMNRNRSYIVSYQDITGNLYEDMYKYDPLPKEIKSGEKASFRIKTGAIPDNAALAVIVGVSKKDAFKTGESEKPSEYDVKDFGNELDITSGDILKVSINNENASNSVDVYCDGQDTPIKDKNYGKLGSKYWQYKYRLPKVVSESDFDAYAYEFSANDMDKTAQILTLANSGESDLTISYLELRVMPEQDYIVKSCVDYESAKCHSAGMTECVEMRTCAKLYGSAQYGNVHESLTYKINAKESGKYKAYIYASASVNYDLNVAFADGQSAEIKIVPQTPSNRFAKIEIGDFYLYDDTDNRITLQTKSDGTAYVDRMEFVRIGDLPQDNDTVAIAFGDFDEENSQLYEKGTNDIYLYNNGFLTYNFNTRLNGGVYRMKVTAREINAGKTVRCSIDGNIYATTVGTDGYATVDIALTGTEHTLTVFATGVNIAGIAFECSKNYKDTKHISFEAWDKTSGDVYQFTICSPKLSNGAIFSNGNSATYKVTAEQAGTYAMKAVYGMKHNSGESGNLTVSVGGKNAVKELSPTYFEWGTYTYALADLGNVTLVSGENEISFAYVGTEELVIDSIMLDLAE